MTTTIIEYIVSPIIVAFCGYITYMLKENKKTTNANAKGTMLLLRCQIINAHRKFVEKGEPMTDFDYQDLAEIHDVYKALGGNGLTDKKWEDIQELDIHNENG